MREGAVKECCWLLLLDCVTVHVRLLWRTTHLEYSRCWP
jgi:hypothetical protein